MKPKQVKEMASVSLMNEERPINMMEITLSEEEKRAALSNTILVMLADGKITREEKAILNKVRKRLGASKEVVNELIKKPSQIKMVVPKSAKDKKQQLVDMLDMMRADGDIAKQEKDLCTKYALAIGLNPLKISQIMDHVESKTARGSSKQIGKTEQDTEGEKKIALSNTILVMLADGKITPEEEVMLNGLRKRLGASKEIMQELLDNQEKLKLVIPDNERQKLRQLTDMIAMMRADGEIDLQERDLCTKFALAIGFNPLKVSRVLEKAEEGMRKGYTPEQITEDISLIIDI
jgi:tellurite resistance protein